MMDKVNCKIGKVVLKSGCELKLFPKDKTNVSKVDLEWGEVVFRAYDDKRLTVADCCYMADLAKNTLSGLN